MKTQFSHKNEAGFTLIEVLLSLTIFSSIVIGMMGMFTQAYDYTSRNESQTVLINVARGAVEFMSNQDFYELKYNIEGNEADTGQPSSQYHGYIGLDSSDKYMFQDLKSYTDASAVDRVNPIQINNRNYLIFVELSPPEQPLDLDTTDHDYFNYFIKNKVYVWEEGSSKPTNHTLEGKIVSETIR